MKAVILAGGYGTRLSEETHTIPKPMVDIGGRPIIWHIMKLYSHYGINDFIICLGYKGYVIKEYFKNYFLHTADVTFDIAANDIVVHSSQAEPWRVTLVDTGTETLTGGRIKRVAKFIDGKRFCLTYGDGVADIDLKSLIQTHISHGKTATVTTVLQPGRFGVLNLDGTRVTGFVEKPTDDGTWINGGYFVLEPSVFDAIENDNTSWEIDQLRQLSETDELRGFRHQGFWYAMDTKRDHLHLEKLWQSGDAPWKVWND